MHTAVSASVLTACTHLCMPCCTSLVCAGSARVLRLPLHCSFVSALSSHCEQNPCLLACFVVELAFVLLSVVALAAVTA